MSPQLVPCIIVCNLAHICTFYNHCQIKVVGDTLGKTGWTLKANKFQCQVALLSSSMLFKL